MDVSRGIDFAGRHSHAVLATMRTDGTPQMSPVLVAVDDERRVVVSTRESAVKVRNVRRDPRAWVCVLPDRFFGSWVQLVGTVDVLSLPDAMGPLEDYYRRVAGEHSDWEDYRRAMREERRCLLRLTVTAAGPDVSG